jgi:hypothetical protein
MKNLVRETGILYGPDAHFSFPNAHDFVAKNSPSATRLGDPAARRDRAVKLC